MTKYREILRLQSLGISQRGIAASCLCSRKTIVKVLERPKELNIVWPLPPETTDRELDKLFFPNIKSLLKPSVLPCIFPENQENMLKSIGAVKPLSL